MQHNAAGERTSEQESGGPGHRTRNTTQRDGTPVNRSQVAQDTAHATQPRDTTHRAGAHVNRSQVAQDTAHTTQRSGRAHR